MRLHIECQLDVYVHERGYPLTPAELRLALAAGEAGHVLRRRNLLVDSGFEAIRGAMVGGEGNPIVASTAYSPQTRDLLFVQKQKLGVSVSPTRPVEADLSLDSGPGDVPVVFVPVPVSGASSPIQRTLNTNFPGTPAPWNVAMSGLLYPTDLVGETITEEGLFTADDKLVARALIAAQAAGTATFSGQPSDTETLTIDDGFGTTEVFEFDDDVTSTPGNIPVTIGASTEDTIDNLVTAIAGTGLQIDATRNLLVAELTHQRGSALGNQALATTSGQIAVVGMSGGNNGLLIDGSIAHQFSHTITFQRES